MKTRKGLRPLGLVAMIDEATRLVRRRPGVYFGISLPVMLPLVLAFIAYLRYVYWYDGAFQNYEAGLIQRSLLLALFFLLRFISHGALCHAAIRDIEGYEPSIWESWREALKNIGPLLFGGLLFWGLTVVSVPFFVIPALFVAAIFAGFPFFVMIEKRHHFRLIGHSFRSSSGQISKIMSMHAVLFFGMALTAMGAWVSLPALLNLFQMFLASDVTVYLKILSFKNPVYPWALFLFCVLLFEPVRVLAQVRINLDAKIRKEGYDLLDRVTLLTGVNLKVAALLLAALTLFGVNTASAETISYDAYQSRIDDTQSLIDSQLDELERGNDVEVGRLRRAFDRLEDIDLDYQGRSIRIPKTNTKDFLDKIASAPTAQVENDLKSLKARLNYLSRGLKTLDRQQGQAQTARDQVKQILDQDRFKRRRRHGHDKDIGQSTVDSFFQKMVNTIKSIKVPEIPWWTSFKKWLGSLFQRSPTINTGGGFSWGSVGWQSIAITVLVLVALAVVAYIAFYRSSLVGSGDGSEDYVLTTPMAQNFDPVVAYETTEDRWRTDARRFASSGQYDFAVRSSYAGLLLTLNSRGWIEFDRTRTNWEYQRDVKKKSRKLAEDMAPLTRVFDEKWYGKKDCNEDDYGEFRQGLDTLLTDLEAKREDDDS